MNVYGASSAQSTLAHTRLRPFETCVVVVVGSMLAKGNQGTPAYKEKESNGTEREKERSFQLHGPYTHASMAGH